MNLTKLTLWNHHQPKILISRLLKCTSVNTCRKKHSLSELIAWQLFPNHDLSVGFNGHHKPDGGESTLRHCFYCGGLERATRPGLPHTASEISSCMCRISFISLQIAHKTRWPDGYGANLNYKRHKHGSRFLNRTKILHPARRWGDKAPLIRICNLANTWEIHKWAICGQCRLIVELLPAA